MSKPLRIKTHKTVKATIQALGGTAKLAKETGLSMSAVSNWLTSGIPPGYHMQFHLMVQERGERIDPSVFGLDSSGRPLKARRAA